MPGVEIKSGRKRPNYSHKFKKLGHWLHSDPHLVLVHYLGDETIYKPMGHGNSRHETEFKRTMPSVINKIKSKEGGAKKYTGKWYVPIRWMVICRELQIHVTQSRLKMFNRKKNRR